MRNIVGLATWPILALVAIGILAGILLLLGEFVPTVLQAVLAAASIVLGFGSWAVWHYPPLYFWRQRVLAAMGRRVAPAWKLRLTYRSRVSPEDRRLVADRLAGTRIRVHDRSNRELELVLDATHMRVHWEDPDLDSEEASHPWFVAVDVNYPPVRYDESIKFLRSEIMPVLEEIERALDVTPDRAYQLVVEYRRGQNPFEGLLIRAAPDETVTNYSVMLRPDAAGEERIELSRERLSLTAVSRSRFEVLVERLLTLDGSWPIAFLSALR